MKAIFLARFGLPYTLVKPPDKGKKAGVTTSKIETTYTQPLKCCRRQHLIVRELVALLCYDRYKGIGAVHKAYCRSSPNSHLFGV